MATVPPGADIVALDREVSDFTRRFDLSPREVEVFRLLLSGVTTATQMAQLLKISPHTVNNHLKSIFEKTGAPNKTELVSAFVRQLLTRIQDCRLFVKRPKVLVVDDEPDICDVVQEFLRDRGLEVCGTTDPVEALEMVKSRALDFVVSDIDMPKLNGLALMQAIRGVHREVPLIIFITGKPQYTLESSLDAGAIAFLEKPLALERLFFTIMEHFVEGTHEKSHLVRVDANIQATVNQAYRFTLTNIGFGGAFVPFGNNVTTAERRFKVGSFLDFSFQLEGEGPMIQARGEVVWRRERPELGLAAGMGVKFTALTPETRRLVEDYVRFHKIISCVPIGRIDKKTA